VWFLARLHAQILSAYQIERRQRSIEMKLLLRHTRKFIIPWCKTDKNHAQ
jgi:hypothetical protein